MACARESRQNKRGGLFWSSSAMLELGSVSSDISSWKIGQAISGSEAPRPARRAREMLAGMGIGKFEGGVGDESWRSSRCGLAREIWDRSFAVYVFWMKRSGELPGRGA